MIRLLNRFRIPMRIATALICAVFWSGGISQVPPAWAETVRMKIPSPPSGEDPKENPPLSFPPPPPGNSETAGDQGENPFADPIPMLSDVHQLTYRPQGRIDPFAPLFRDEPEESAQPAKAVRKKRVPQTPLEKMDLSQIKLTAIFRTQKGYRALVEESTGKGYMIDTGTYIGINSGKVISIQPTAVVVEEEIEDALGNVRTEVRELRLTKPAEGP